MNNAYIEQNIICNLIKFPSNILHVDGKFFVSDTARSIFRGISVLVNNSIELTVRNIVLESSKYSDSIRQDVIEKILEIETKEGDFPYLYKSLRSAKAQLDIQEGLTENLVKESGKKEMSLDNLVSFRDLLTEKIDEITGKEDNMLTLPNWLDRYEAALEKRKDGSCFYSTGDSGLDKILTTAFEPGYFVVLAGHSGAGKSSYGLMLNNKQINRMIPSLRISNEMTDISDMDRLISQRNMIPISFFYPKKNDEEGVPDFVFQTIRQEREKLEKCRFFRYVYMPDLDLDDVEFLIKKAKRDMGVDYLCVTIDLLTKLRDFSGDSKASSYEDAVNKLDTIAKKTNSSILGIVQLRRPSDKITVKTEEDLDKFRPQIQEIKNAGALEERARIVMTIFRKRFWAERMMQNDPALEIIEDIAEISVLKQNLGNIGTTIRYLFNGECASFAKYVDE